LWFRAQYCPVNAVKLTSIARKEFTRKVNLRHFFVPQVSFPRSMTGTMLRIDCDDNPAFLDSVRFDAPHAFGDGLPGSAQGMKTTFRQ
jgi:hypothetical protein